MTEPAVLPLRRTVDEPGKARQLVAPRMRAFDEEALDNALIMVSELVTNVVLHGETPARLEVQLSDTELYVNVFDSGPPFRTSSSALPAEQNPHGRGLVIVAALATSWGISTEPGSGKSVWFRLALPGRPEEMR